MSSVLSDLDARALDRAATALCLDAVSAIRPSQLDLPTPCREWTLGELVAHLVAENRGFAANAAGQVDRTAWRPGPPDEITLAKFPGSVEKVSAAFAAKPLFSATRWATNSPRVHSRHGVGRSS
jgi:uncharacterized protein (TIGR03083 family)